MSCSVLPSASSPCLLSPSKLLLKLQFGLPQAEFSQDLDADPSARYLTSIGTYCFTNSQYSPILLSSIIFIHSFITIIAHAWTHIVASIFMYKKDMALAEKQVPYLFNYLVLIAIIFFIVFIAITMAFIQAAEKAA